ncbi:MAG: hypothetical protein QXK76_01275 [Candidatus Woesearchaeota archaeon]
MYDFDIVIPKNNEEKFIDVALSLGYKKIVFLSDNINYKYSSERIKVISAFLVKDVNIIKFARKSFDYVVADSERVFFESKVDFIINSELIQKSDSFHYRRTGLNQVNAKLCKENDICLVFSFSNILDKNFQNLGRMYQDMYLAKKYNLKVNAFSLSKEPMCMKSRIILESFLRVLNEH